MVRDVCANRYKNVKPEKEHRVISDSIRKQPSLTASIPQNDYYSNKKLYKILHSFFNSSRQLNNR